jgi:uncharacterized protein YifE (UPF0438 family)
MADADNPHALTPQEQALLEKHISFYLDLESGRRKPSTDAQEHFVKVSQGLVAAETIHELAFAKHMWLRAAQRAMRRNESQEDLSDEPRAEWFSREDWYKLRGRRHGDTPPDSTDAF